MIYEIRTYDIKPTMVPEYQKRFYQKLPERVKLSKLAGHWYTEVGPINQIIAIWPYSNNDQRIQIRSEVEQKGIWPPDSGDLVQGMVSEIYLPAPFMRAMEPKNIGPIYEMRIYTYPPEDMPDILHTWQAAMPAREQLSPLVGCWYKESGGNDNFIHMWAYESFEERLRIREHAKTTGIWPPKSSARLLKQNSKILLPASFSPMQ